MNDVILVVIMVAAFLLAIALVRLLGRMIDRDADPIFDADPDVFDAEGLDGPR
jgi:hypothetical protein